MFLTIVRLGSLSRAADHLYLAQSTVSHRLRSLEASLGVRLLERGRGLHTVNLTPEGQQFLSIARRWELLAGELRLLRSVRQRVTIGAPDSVSNHLLPPAYEELIEQVTLRLVTANSEELLRLLHQRTIDLALVLFDRPDPAIVLRPLMSEPMVAVTGKDGSTDAPIATSELDPAKGVHINWSPGHERWYLEHWDIAEFPIHVDVAHTASHFLKDPSSWVIAPLSVAKGLVTDTMAIRFIDSPPPDRVINVATLRDHNTLTAATISVVNEALERCVAQSRALTASLTVGS